MAMKGQGRVQCEVDDLIRLYLSKQSGALQLAGEDLVERMLEINKELKGRWNDDLGTGMEIMETMLLAYLSETMQKYVSGSMTGKEKKFHDDNCVLKSVI